MKAKKQVKKSRRVLQNSKGKKKFAFGDIEFFRLLGKASEEADHALAMELAAPAKAVIRAIYEMAVTAQVIAKHAKREDLEKAALRVSEEVELALTWISHELVPSLRILARDSQHPDLLIDVIGNLIGDGHEAANLIERYEELFPANAKNKDGTIEPESFPHLFAWDAYLRIEALDKMVDVLPKHIETASRHMNAWPMLRYLHNSRKKRLKEIVSKLKLGADYPLDVSNRPSWRPDTPMVQYLDRVVWRFSLLHRFRATRKKWMTEDVKSAQRVFSEPGEKESNAKVIEVLRAGLSSIEELTKNTAELWANVVIVPYIMAADVKTPASCNEPALLAIWKQKGVKSAAIFESRLTPVVVRTLKSMAPP